MAVIRQQTQVFNKPVGVVRSSQGSQQVAQAISRAAGVISDIAYEKAAINAQEFGQEQALALEASQITAIDPATNKPVALTPPPGYGGIAAQAYQDVVNKRYQTSIIREIEAKGAEIAESSPTAAIYKERMSEYIDSMYNAEGEATGYSNYIKENGFDYVQKTYSALRNKETVAARQRLERDAKMTFMRRLAGINSRIAVGEISEDLDNEIASVGAEAMNMYLTDMLTPTQALEVFNLHTTAESMRGKSSLIGLYSEGDEALQANVRIAITDPMRADDIVGPEVGRMIRQTLASTTADSLISALNLTAEASDQRADAMSNDFRIANPVSPIMQFSYVKEKYKGQTEDVQNAAFADLFLMKVEPYISTDNLPLMMRELSKRGMMDLSVFPEGAREVVRSLSPDVRDGIIKDFKQRASLEAAIGDTDVKRIVSQTAASIERIASADSIDDAINAHNDAGVSIEMLPPEQQRDKRNAADAELAAYINANISPAGITTQRMKDIHNALNLNVDSFQGTAEEEQYFNALYKARNASRTLTQGAMTKMLETRESDDVDDINTTRLNVVQMHMQNGNPVSKDDMKLFGENKYKGSIPTVQTLVRDQEFLNRMSVGNLTPEEIGAIEASLVSADAESQDFAFDLVNKMMNVEQNIDGSIVKRDLALQILSPKTYRTASAAVNVANSLGVRPSVVMGRLAAYDGDIDADISKSLGVRNIDDIFKTRDLEDFTPGAQREFKDILRYHAVSGMVMNPSNLEKITDKYLEDLVEDDRVLGAKVGERTDRSLDIPFTSSQQRKIMFRIAGIIQNDSEYLNAFGFEKSADFAKRTQQNILARSLGDKIKFLPIEDTWISSAKNRSFYVMIDSGAGYVQFEDEDGSPMIISEADFLVREDTLSGYFNRALAAKQAGSDKDYLTENIRYILFKDPELYETFDDFMKAKDAWTDYGDYDFESILGVDGVKGIYEEMMNGQ